jgi:hypothetical protein
VVPVRKAGKLPRATHAASYDLEYGSATLEVHTDAFLAGQRVLVVDDVLATGGTAAATLELVERAGGSAIGLTVLLELSFLSGRARLAGRPVHASSPSDPGRPFRPAVGLPPPDRADPAPVRERGKVDVAPAVCDRPCVGTAATIATLGA